MPPDSPERGSGALPARIERLARIAAAPARTILGLMSGTSLDGLDLALCHIAGHGAGTRLELLRFATRPYAPAERERLREIAFREEVPLRRLIQLQGWLAEWHAQAVSAQLAEWRLRPEDVDALASHGQTVFHAPSRAPHPPTPSPYGEGVSRRSRDGGEVAYDAPETLHSTLQIGDGDRLAVRTGILAVSDFRQKEIALGGQGAPLAPYAEALLFARPGRSRVLLNIGGIANFTWLPPEDPLSRWIAGDTGPGNTLIDAAVRRYFPNQSEGYDRDGRLAGEGRVDPRAVAWLKENAYFARPFPKSTGPEEFAPGILDFLHQFVASEGRGRGRNIVATVTRLSAETIADAIRATVRPLAGSELIVSGGGARNRTLMRWLAETLPEVTLAESAVLGIPPQAKEAVLFAVLANETLAGAGFAARDGSGRQAGFGKISFPD
jgi:anhydro-N-acetylmuramic acid kinase